MRTGAGVELLKNEIQANKQISGNQA